MPAYASIFIILAPALGRFLLSVLQKIAKADFCKTGEATSPFERATY
jgi:hypothetical protein